jgi:hypothetical protein
MTHQQKSDRPPDELERLTAQLLDCGGVLSQIVSHMVEWENAGRSSPDTAPIPDIARQLVASALGDMTKRHSRLELRKATTIVEEATSLIAENIFFVPLDVPLDVDGDADGLLPDQ